MGGGPGGGGLLLLLIKNQLINLIFAKFVCKFVKPYFLLNVFRRFGIPIVPWRAEEEAEAVARGHHVHGLLHHRLRPQGGV